MNPGKSNIHVHWYPERHNHLITSAGLSLTWVILMDDPRWIILASRRKENESAI